MNDFKNAPGLLVKGCFEPYWNRISSFVLNFICKTQIKGPAGRPFLHVLYRGNKVFLGKIHSSEAPCYDIKDMIDKRMVVFFSGMNLKLFFNLELKKKLVVTLYIYSIKRVCVSKYFEHWNIMVRFLTEARI